MKKIFSCKSLSIGYPLSNPLISKLNFNINENDCLQVRGMNGSGKTTLLNTLIGILPKLKGEVQWNILSSQIGWVPQEINVMISPLTVVDLIKYSSLKTLDLTEIRNILLQVGLENFFYHRLDQLSGGQRKRVYLARALINQPKLLILDEPSTNLDKSGTKNLANILKNLNQKYNIALLYTSHNENWLSPRQILDLDELDQKY